MRFLIISAISVLASVASAQPAPLAASGTPLKLMVWNEVSTRTAKPGDRFLLRLETAVIAGEAVVIPRGAQAWGEVMSASASGMGGKAGKLETRLLHIEVGGRPVRIAPAKPDALADKGRDGSLQIVLATAALTPWGPFARGNNARLKAGALVDAVLAEDLMPAPATP
jgi:hypothetical protein